MVFSQTSHKTRSILKVVDIDCLKPAKSELENGSDGVLTQANTSQPSSPQPTTSFSEVRTAPQAISLKLEPESTMFYNNSDCEFFQDLVQWCSDPVKEEQQLTTESNELKDERATTHTDTLTQFSPIGWDAFDVKSSGGQVGFTTPTYPLSPSMEAVAGFDIPHAPALRADDNFQEQFLDIDSLPVVIEDSASETVVADAWNASHGWNTHTYTKQNIHNMPFIDQEDSLDTKYMTPVIPREVESNDVIISEFVLSEGSRGGAGELQPPAGRRALALDVSRAAPAWPTDISTPEVLSYVEQLENEKCLNPEPTISWGAPVTGVTIATPEPSPSAPLEYEPITPKSESHVESEEEPEPEPAPRAKRRRRDTEDSDETYTPYVEHTASRKYKRRKPDISIKEMITALEGSQQLTKARRGRPPKRRDSTVSSVCSVDDAGSLLSSHDGKYRELRDKNNEASKRSRMNRKLKELQMEQLALDLEERNQKLKVRADILEDMTKKLKDALMTAILKQK